MKLTFKDFPRWLNPKLSHKEIKAEYEKEIKEINDMAAWRKSKYKIPNCPWAYYCVAFTDYTKYQWQTNNQH